MDEENMHPNVFY